MLSADFVNTLQLVTFPFEFIGLMLAAIEIHFPRLSERISQHILNEGSIRIAFNPKSVFELVAGIACGLLLALVSKYSDSVVLFNVTLVTALALLISYTLAAHWVPRRVIGTFGLSLAAFGLIAEATQLLVTAKI